MLCFLRVIWVVWSVSALTRLVVFRVGCVQQPPCSGVRDAVCFKLDLNIRSVPLLFFFFGFFFLPQSDLSVDAAEQLAAGVRAEPPPSLSLTSARLFAFSHAARQL